MGAKDLTRAKNAVKRRVSHGSSDGENMVTDLGAQMVMTGGKNLLDTSEMLAKIDAVTEADVKAVQGLFTGSGAEKVTVAAWGNVLSVPHYDDIVKLFGSKK